MQEQSNLTPPAPPMTPPPPAAPVVMSTQSKGFPKKIIFIVLGILVALVGIVVAIQALGPALNERREITLRWWGLWEDESIIQPLIDEYQAAHPNVKITYENQSKQDYRERLTNALASGTGPDIFRIHNTWVPMFSSQLEPMSAEIMSAAEFQSTFYPVVTADLTNSSGKIMGIPLGFDTIAMFINQEIFDTYGKVVPTTWDEVRDLARALTIKDEQGVIRQSGAAFGNTQNVDHWPEIVALLMLQNKVNMSNPTGVRAEQAMDFYSRFSRVDAVWDETLPNSTVAFAAGKVAMYFGPSWRIHEIRQQNPSLNFRVLTTPQLRKESDTDPNVYYATYWVEGVSAKSKEKQAAWEFLKFLSTKESLEKLYTNASSSRLFGEPYPRIDMQNMIATDPVVGAFIQQGREAKSWYLASRTFDGPTGINSQINKYFEDAVNAVNQGTAPSSALSTVAQGIVQVLGRYGLISTPSR